MINGKHSELVGSAQGLVGVQTVAETQHPISVDPMVERILLAMVKSVIVPRVDRISVVVLLEGDCMLDIIPIEELRKKRTTHGMFDVLGALLVGVSQVVSRVLIVSDVVGMVRVPLISVRKVTSALGSDFVVEGDDGTEEVFIVTSQDFVSNVEQISEEIISVGEEVRALGPD